MKSTLQPTLNLFANLESSFKSAQNQSPYLKAILSGKLMTAKNEKSFETANPDRDAASRYIKECQQSNKH